MHLHAELARRRLGDVNLPWVRTHFDRTAHVSRGIVVTGRMTEKIHVAQFSDTDFRFLDVEAADETAEWFVRGESLSCEAFAPASVVQIYATNRCCDVFPPMDIPCLLAVEQAEVVGESLRRFLESAGFQASGQRQR